MSKKYETEFMESVRAKMLGESPSSYTKRIMMTKRWDDVVDYGSPMTAWTPQMFDLLKKAGGDTIKAAEMLRKLRKQLREAKTTSHPLNVSMNEISNTLNDLLRKMDKNDPLYDQIKDIVDGVKTVAVSTTKVAKPKTKHAQEPDQKKPIINNGNPLEVGDVLNDHFSYTMTFNTFYQVVEVKGKRVTVREIEKEWISGNIGWNGQVTPIKDKFVTSDIILNMRGNFAKKSDVSIKSKRGGRVYYIEPKSDGTYPSFYENHLD